MRTVCTALLSLFLLLPAAARAAGSMELFFEPLDGQGWQLFFLANTVKGQLKSAGLKAYPLVSKGADGKYSATRGDAELEEGRRVAALAAAWPARQLAYLNARSMTPAPEGWRDAAVFAGVNPDELSKKAAESDAALDAAAARAAELGAKETALYIDGKKYAGSQRLMPLFEAVNAALPQASRQPAPAGYKAPPKPVPPGFWVVLAENQQKNDQLVSVFDRYFEDIKPLVLDYNAPERAAKFPWLDFAPAYVLTATDEAKTKLQRELEAGLFKERSGFLVYEDRQRRGYFASRQERKGVLEIFVMSQCPFGVMAENAVFGAEQDGLLPKDLKIEVHYIGDAKKNDKGEWEFNSLHGEPEWQENARQLYIAKKFPAKFRAYLMERNKDYNSKDWQTPAKAAGLDPAVIEKNFAEAKNMLAADFEASSKLGMSTSPSFVLDGRHFMVGAGELAKFAGFEKLPPPGQPGAGCGK